MANIRTHYARTHERNPEKATGKAEALILLLVRPFNPVSVSKGKPEIVPVACRIRVIRASECPAQALGPLRYKDNRIFA